jgi:hypothetical protein
MADSITIVTGMRHILINGGPEFIEFNPSDISFAERFYALIADFNTKKAGYEERADAIDGNKTLDANGLPANVPEGLALMREVCEYMRAEIDKLFGAGTSNKVFGSALSIDMFTQFFDGLMPFIQQARTSQVGKYLIPATKPQVKRHRKSIK